MNKTDKKSGITHGKKVFVALVILAALGALGRWWLTRSGAPPAQTPSTLTISQEVEAGKAANAASLSPQAAQAASQVAAAQFAHIYTGPGFSFGYPDSLKVGSFVDPSSGATTITAQDASAHVGFQVYVSSWQGGAITQTEVNQDLPQIQAHGFTAVSLDGAQGLAFAASDPNFGDSLQVWLARGGALYQISTYASQGPLLSKVLGTWRWTK